MIKEGSTGNVGNYCAVQSLMVVLVLRTLSVLIWLVKQWWRIMQNEKSLCFNLLKAKYFPNADANLVGKGHKASYLWKSLLEGKKVVEQGTV